MAKTYRGVTMKGEPGNRTYLATIRAKGMTFNCGTHPTEIDAAKARDRMIITKGLNVPLQVFTPTKDKGVYSLKK